MRGRQNPVPVSEYPALVIALGVWAVAGLIFWIPLYVASVVGFAVATFGAALTGRPPRGARMFLVWAARFYQDGFVLAFASLRQSSNDNEGVGPEERGFDAMLSIVAVALTMLVVCGLWAFRVRVEAAESDPRATVLRALAEDVDGVYIWQIADETGMAEGVALHYVQTMVADGLAREVRPGTWALTALGMTEAATPSAPSAE